MAVCTLADLGKPAVGELQIFQAMYTCPSIVIIWDYYIYSNLRYYWYHQSDRQLMNQIVSHKTSWVNNCFACKKHPVQYIIPNKFIPIVSLFSVHFGQGIIQKCVGTVIGQELYKLVILDTLIRVGIGLKIVLKSVIIKWSEINIHLLTRIIFL